MSVNKLIGKIFLYLLILTIPEGGVISMAYGLDNNKGSNRLRFEKSPYLLQHADNPIDWYAWSEEAFQKAVEEDKPIFLSIGYSTCHWCHVMEHESFEDEEVAKLMNEVFVSIKVDREERPDIDNIYMTVCQMMRGNCGWPLTIIMTAEGKPFFSDTYIPKERRFGRYGMMELIPEIERVWKSDREKIVKTAESVTTSLQQISGSSPGGELEKSILKRAYDQLEERFDREKGGFGRAPKFPTPHNLLFLLGYWNDTGDKEALEMVESTLQAMRRGGIYDHIGFGFHRYSTDSDWLTPHFEKMLYDQALIAMACTSAFQATGKEEYKETAKEIFTYVLRDMTDEKGGFYSAEDADSEGEEGKFYVWTKEEIEKVLTEKEADMIVRLYHIESEGNFHDEATGRKSGTNILHLKKSLQDLAAERGGKERAEIIESARKKLFDIREKRVHPYKDDKILTDWNGLMIAALAGAGQAFDEPVYTEAAGKAAAFILKDMRDSSGRLLHRHREGSSEIMGTVDDYAFFIWGLINLYEGTFDTAWLKTALDLNRDLIKYFHDDKEGGFYFTADDGEKLLTRQKEIYDSAVPSGNSVAMLNLLRLSRMTGDHDLDKRASRIGSAFSGSVNRVASAHTFLMTALDFGFGPSYEVVITGDPEGEDTKEMIRALRRQFAPNKVVLFRPSNEETPMIIDIANFVKYQAPVNGKATAYVCLNYACKSPTNEIDKMLEALNIRKVNR